MNKHIHSFVFWYKTIDSHNIQKFHTTDHAPMRKPNFCSKLVVCECELWFCGVHGWVATSDKFRHGMIKCFSKNVEFYSDIARDKEIEIFTKLKLLNRQFHLLTLISINGVFLSTHFKRALKRKKGSENVQIIIISGS